jgi:Tfp pilus assembly protein PilO
MRAATAWWRLWWVWSIPAVLVTANVIWLVAVRGTLLGRGTALSRDLTRIEEEITLLQRQRQSLSQTAERLEALQRNLAALRQGEMRTMRERLVPFLEDVMRQAQTAGLQPERIGYNARAEGRSGVVTFRATYALEGSYGEIRRCISNLENSSQFIIIESLGLRGRDDASSLQVGVQITVGTYFSDYDAEFLQELGLEEAGGGQ